MAELLVAIVLGSLVDTTFCKTQAILLGGHFFPGSLPPLAPHINETTTTTPSK